MLLLPILALTGAVISKALPSVDDQYDEPATDHVLWRPEGQTPFIPKAQDEVSRFTGGVTTEHTLVSDDTKSIYELLAASGKFTKLVKVINISDEIVSLLNDTSAG